MCLTQVVAMTMMMVVMMMINHDDDADDHHAAEAGVIDTSCRHHRLVVPGKPTHSHISVGSAWSQTLSSLIHYLHLSMVE